MTTRRSFTKDFKLDAVRRLERERGYQSAAEVARALGIRRNLLYKWQVQLRRKGQDTVFPGRGRCDGAAVEVARLKRVLARLEAENAMLKQTVGCLAEELV
jgi:transposase-like protein